MTQVYIKQHDKKLLWKGDDWTSAIELALMYEFDDARKIIAKRWSKGVRNYKRHGVVFL